MFGRTRFRKMMMNQEEIEVRGLKIKVKSFIHLLIVNFDVTVLENTNLIFNIIKCKSL